DFGLARTMHSSVGGGGGVYTPHVSTRWYRAPEVLLREGTYGSAIDLWAVGAIMAEMFSLKPLFPGDSEIDQIRKICLVVGVPREQTWPEGVKLGQLIGNSTSGACTGSGGGVVDTLRLSERKDLGDASPEAIQLMEDLLQLNPKNRPTASQALQYP